MSNLDLTSYVNNVLFTNDRFKVDENRAQSLKTSQGLNEREFARYKNMRARVVELPERLTVLQQFKIISKNGLPTISIVQHLVGDWSIALLHNAECEIVSSNLSCKQAAFMLAHTVADAMTVNSHAIRTYEEDLKSAHLNR